MDRAKYDLRNLVIDIQKILDSDSYSLSDLTNLTDAVYVIRDSKNSAPLITKSIVGGTVVKSNPSTLLVTFSETDFDTGFLTENKSYHISLGIVYGSLTKFVKIPLAKNSEILNIIPDGVN